MPYIHEFDSQFIANCFGSADAFYFNSFIPGHDS